MDYNILLIKLIFSQINVIYINKSNSSNTFCIPLLLKLLHKLSLILSISMAPLEPQPLNEKRRLYCSSKALTTNSGTLYL